MDPIRGASAYTPQAAETLSEAHPSGHERSLTSSMLSNHALDALNAKEMQGSEQEKTLAGFAKEAIVSGRLQLSPNQSPNGIAQFGMQHHQDVLIIQAKLNERSEYEVLGVGFERGSSPPLSMKLPAPAPYSRSPLESMPKEIIHMVLDELPNGGPKSRVTSLALSSKRLHALGLEKTQEKAECSASLDRLNAIKNIPASQGPNRLGGARLIEFKAVLDSLDGVRGKERMDLIGGLADNISSLSFKSQEGFKLMLGLTDNIRLSENPKAVNAEHEAEQDRDRNKTIAYLVSKLARAGQGSDVSEQDRPEVFERLCSALEVLKGKNGANHAAAALPKLASWYTSHPETLGPERFGRLINLAVQNKLDASDRSKSEMVKSLTSKLAQHDESEHIANHFNALCGVSKAIASDEIKADVMTYLTERLNWIDDEKLRSNSKNHIDDAVSTINNPVLKAQVAAVTPIPQDD